MSKAHEEWHEDNPEETCTGISCDAWLSSFDDEDIECDTDDDYADAMTPDEVWTEGGIKD